MTALITLTDSIIAPDGEEYRAVWGTIGEVPHGKSIGSNISIPHTAILCVMVCPRPQKDNTEYTETKEGRIPHEPQVGDFPHIYYAE